MCEKTVKKVRKSQAGRKHLQKTHLIKDCYPKYIGNSYNSTVRKWTTQFLKCAKDLDTLPEKIDKWQFNMWKDVQHHKSLGNYKLKKQWVRTTYLLEWLKSPTLIMQMMTGMESNRNSYVASGNARWYTVTLKDNLAVSYKTEHAVTIWPSNCTQTFIPTKWKFVLIEDPSHGCL